MFVYSVRASAVRFIVVLFIAIAAMAAFLAMIPAPSDHPVGQLPSSLSATDEESRLKYINSWGWTVDGQPEISDMLIPETMADDIALYNELQKKQGFDLQPYAGKTIEKYTYEITNYKDCDGTVYINLLVSDGNVIGGDVMSADNEGFRHGFAPPADE